jgi:hypothetical protein
MTYNFKKATDYTIWQGKILSEEWRFAKIGRVLFIILIMKLFELLPIFINDLDIIYVSTSSGFIGYFDENN